LPESQTPPPTRHRVALVTACSKSKGKEPTKAYLLYRLPKFRYLYKHRGPAVFYILSAKHGLIDAEQVIEPYDQKITESRLSELGPQVAKALRGYDRVVYFRGSGGQLYERLLKEVCSISHIPLTCYGHGFNADIGLTEQMVAPLRGIGDRPQFV